jgi:hypothetical protein
MTAGNPVIDLIIYLIITYLLFMASFTKPEHSEGTVAKTIEDQTAKLPSDVFLWAALGSMGVSLALKCMGRSHTALFVGQWAAPFLLFGVYNKIVKTQGSE